jgi:RNA polymerase sigma-70 factor (ECF subfamily)
VGDEAPLGERFAALYREHYGLVLSMMEHRLDDRATAEDLASEVFALAWKRMNEGQDLTIPWVYQAARNLIGNEYQRRARQASFIDKVGTHTDFVDERMEDLAPAAEVRQRLRKLPEEERELIYMAHWDELTGAEIAEVLGCSTASARKRLERARKAAIAELIDLMNLVEDPHG